jgi:3-methyl-2-oxobutanoate hydroxymethyltransferase
MVSDMFGLFQVFTPKFVKKYANLAEQITRAMEDYVKDVRTPRFPEDVHTYKTEGREKEKLDLLVKK